MSIDRVPVPGVTRSLFLCARDDVAPDPDGALAAAGDASLVVCLNEEHELERYPSYVEWLRINEGERALWSPTRDWNAQPLVSAWPTIQTVAHRLERGDGVLVHCAMGQGRAGTMAVCVMLTLGVDRDEALRLVAQHRRHAGPASRAQWALVDAVAAQVAGDGSN